MSKKKFRFDERVLEHIKPTVRAMQPYTVAGGQFAAIKLNQNENPFDFPANLKLEILNQFYSENWNRYPDVFPNLAAEKIAAFLGVPAEAVIVGNGSNELIYTIFFATLSRGSRVLIPSPTFLYYEKVADIMEAEVIKVAMTASLTFDVAAILEEALRSQPRILVLSTPNNPTSKSMTFAEIEEIASQVKSLVVVDEAYIEFSRERSALELIYEHPNVIILRTLSKAFSLAGVRLGYLVANPTLAAELLKPKIPFATNRLAELVAVKILENYELVEQSVKIILAERDRVFAALQAMPNLNVHESDTNFFIVEVASPGDVFESLKAKNILVRNVSSYPMMEKCLRIGVGTAAENDALLTALKERLS